MTYGVLYLRVNKAVQALQNSGQLSQTIIDLRQKLEGSGDTFEQLYANVISGRAGFSRALVWIGLPNHQRHLFYVHPAAITAHGQHIDLQKLLCGTCQTSTVPGQLMGVPNPGSVSDGKYNTLIGYFFAHPDFFVPRNMRRSQGNTRDG